MSMAQSLSVMSGQEEVVLKDYDLDLELVTSGPLVDLQRFRSQQDLFPFGPKYGRDCQNRRAGD